MDLCSRNRRVTHASLHNQLSSIVGTADIVRKDLFDDLRYSGCSRVGSVFRRDHFAGKSVCRFQVVQVISSAGTVTLHLTVAHWECIVFTFRQGGLFVVFFWLKHVVIVHGRRNRARRVSWYQCGPAPPLLGVDRRYSAGSQKPTARLPFRDTESLTLYRVSINSMNQEEQKQDIFQNTNRWEIPWTLTRTSLPSWTSHHGSWINPTLAGRNSWQ